MRKCHGADERKYDRLQRCIASNEELELGTAEGNFLLCQRDVKHCGLTRKGWDRPSTMEEYMELIGIFILVIPFVIGYFVGKQAGIKEAQKDGSETE